MTTVWEQEAALYERLYLTPLDEFIEQQLGRLKERQASAGIPADGILGPQSEHLLYRQLGATTWMCVRAVNDLLKERNVEVVGRDNSEANRIGHLVLQFWQRLGGEIKSATLKGADLRDGGRLVWTSGATAHSKMRTPPGYLTYDDKVWEERITRRAKGPFHMIREVRAESNGGLTVYNAYAEDDELVMEVPFETAQELAGKSKVRLL